MLHNRTLRCFIIGPMRDEADENGLHWLQRLDRSIIEPMMIDIGLMKDPKSDNHPEFNYVVQTPWDLKDPHIMDGVVAAIDSADIVIADLTNENANVYYELSLAHSLGKQVITIGDKPAFDIASMRHIPVKQNTTQEVMPPSIRRQLIDAIKAAHENITEYSTPKNPITAFYGTSLPRASSTVAVAQTYVTNFVVPIVQTWTSTNHEHTAYLYDVNRKAFENNRDVLISMGRNLEDRHGLRLHIVIPDRIEYASKERINMLRGTTKGQLQEFMVSAPHRSITVNALYDGKKYQFYDFPTPLEGLQKTIERRMRSLEIVKDSQEWRERELDEINLFTEALQREITNKVSGDRDLVKILRFDSNVLSLRRDEARKAMPKELTWIYDLLVRSR